MAWWSYPPLDRSPRVPQTRHRKRRDAVFIAFTTLPQKTSRDSRVEKNLLFSPDHSLALSFLSLSLSEKKMPVRRLPKNTSVGRERRRHQNVVGRIVALLERSLVYLERVLPKERIEYSFCVYTLENVSKSFPFPPPAPPSQKIKTLNQPPLSPIFFSHFCHSRLDFIQSRSTPWRWSFDTAPENKAHERRSVVSKGGPTSRKRNTAREERRRRKREENVEPNDCVGIIIIIIIAERSLAGEPTER